MQIGIDLGASKIESVILDEQGNENHRERVDCPKNYNSIIEQIRKIVSEIEKKTQKTLPVGVCHPGVHSPQSGLVKNAPNCIWIEKNHFKKIYVKHWDEKFFAKMMQIVLHYQKQ